MNASHQPLLDLIHEKCGMHQLELLPSQTNMNEYMLGNRYRSKAVKVHILVPNTYMPEKKELPYDIETACSFSIPPAIFSMEPHVVIFAYHDELSGKQSFLILQTSELLERFEKLNKCPQSDDCIQMVLYAGNDDYILDATNISGEGEWFFFGGRMGKDSKWDYSMYLNRWEVLFDGFRLP